MNNRKDDNPFEEMWSGWLVGTAILLAVYTATTIQSEDSVLGEIVGAVAITMGGFAGSIIVAVAGTLINRLFGGEDGFDGMGNLRFGLLIAVIALIVFAVLHSDLY